MAATDAEDLEKNAFKYFSHTNYLNKCIVSQEKTLIKHLGARWNELPLQHRDNLLDLLFVDDNTRQIYLAGDGDLDGGRESSDADVQESFPRLFINSGQKINVDFENDLWTWRDEHSGPFSWMSRSQQDLTLADLEPENISKPQPKSAKVDAEEEGNTKKAQPQFTYPCGSWYHDIIDDFKKNERDIVLTPSTSMNLATTRGESSLKEVNPAFEGSCDDLSREASPAHEVLPKAATDETDSLPASDKKQKGKDKGRRSPSPKKILRSGSFKKSPAKDPDHGGQKLIEDDSEVGDDTSHNVFSNPVMESEWSTFVGDQNNDGDMKTAKAKNITKAPEEMSMDRGEVITSGSPYQGDHVQLLEPSSSSVEAYASPARSEFSAESTPDHTTHLLKGMQSPVHKMYHADYTKVGIAHSVGTTSSEVTPEQSQAATYVNELPTEKETEEVLIADGNKIVMIPQEENKRDSDIPTTGFDFLDNW